MVVAVNTLLGVVVEILRDVAGDAALAVPKLGRGTLTSAIDDTTTAFTLLAFLQAVVPESVLGTDIAPCPVKVRILLRTINTLFELNVVNLVLRTAFALQVVIVEVERMETLQTFASVIVVQRILAFTFTLYLIVPSPVVAFLTLVRSLIVHLVLATLLTLLSVEERLGLGTKHALLLHRTV